METRDTIGWACWSNNQSPSFQLTCIYATYPLKSSLLSSSSRIMSSYFGFSNIRVRMKYSFERPTNTTHTYANFFLSTLPQEVLVPIGMYVCNTESCIYIEKFWWTMILFPYSTVEISTKMYLKEFTTIVTIHLILKMKPIKSCYVSLNRYTSL